MFGTELQFVAPAAPRERYTHAGGLSTRTFEEQLEKRPEEIIRIAVKGMLPKNRLARKQLTKLKVYAGGEHPHQAQNPKPLSLEGVR